jgi:hypothetical protein
MLSAIASLFRSANNAALMIEQATEQGLDEVVALRAQRQITNQADLAALMAEYSTAGLGELKTSQTKKKVKKA